MEGSTLGPVGPKRSLSPIPAREAEGTCGTPGSLGCGKCDLCPGIPATHTQATWVTGLMKSKRHARSWLEIGRPRQALSLHLNRNDVVSGYHGQAQHTGFPSREGIWKEGSEHQGGKPASVPPLLSHDF